MKDIKTSQISSGMNIIISQT